MEKKGPKLNGFVAKETRRPDETVPRNRSKEKKRGGGEECLLRNAIGRELDRVIEELFEVESKQERRRKGALLPLWQEEQKMCPSEVELEDIDALLGDNGEALPNIDDDEDDSVPFHGFPLLPDDEKQTRLIALIKNFESEEEINKDIVTFETIAQQEGDEAECKERKHELCLTACRCRKTQKA